MPCRKGSRLLLVAAALVLEFAYSPIAHSAYQYGYNYGGYGYPGNYYGSRSPGPIISLELDETKSRNLDLRIAARDDKPEDVVQTLADGADVNGKSDDGETALMYAARSCSFQSAEVLLRHHAAVNERDMHGRTALIYAVMETCLPVTKLLLSEPHVALSIKDDQHYSVIDYAKQGASLEVDGPTYEILKLVNHAWGRKSKIQARRSEDPQRVHHVIK
jgi:ankyrin repeat protein